MNTNEALQNLRNKWRSAVEARDIPRTAQLDKRIFDVSTKLGNTVEATVAYLVPERHLHVHGMPVCPGCGTDIDHAATFCSEACFCDAMGGR